MREGGGEGDVWCHVRHRDYDCMNVSLQGFCAPSHDDKLMEVVGITGFTHIVSNYSPVVY